MALYGGSLRRWGAGCRVVAAIAVAGCALLALAVAPSYAGAQTQTRYSVAGECFDLVSVAAGAPTPDGSSLRFQATDLGSYLLYRPAGDFLAAGAGDVVGPAAQPSPAADWVVEDASPSGFTLSPKSAPTKILAVSGSQLVLVPRSAAGDAARFQCAPASGCAVFPEAELNVSGT